MKEYKVVFWDFDGVIKESVDVKVNAFLQLFEPFGDKILEKVLQHNAKNGGMSRYNKIPIYLEWAGECVTAEKINLYCQRFNQIVVSKVIESPWVLGVENFLQKNAFNQIFILITATPQDEIEYILSALNLEHVFYKVYGSPIKKSEAMLKSIIDLQLKPDKCIAIGDSTEDFLAAKENKVPFLLRKTEHNKDTFIFYSGPSITDFRSL